MTPVIEGLQLLQLHKWPIKSMVLLWMACELQKYKSQYSLDFTGKSYRRFHSYGRSSNAKALSLLGTKISDIGEESAGCFTLFVFLVFRDCCVALPHDATGLSAVCDCSIS